VIYVSLAKVLNLRKAWVVIRKPLVINDDIIRAHHLTARFTDAVEVHFFAILYLRIGIIAIVVCGRHE